MFSAAKARERANYQKRKWEAKDFEKVYLYIRETYTNKEMKWFKRTYLVRPGENKETWAPRSKTSLWAWIFGEIISLVSAAAVFYI